MLTFDPVKHYYFWKGVRVPSTTEICSILAPRPPVDEYYLHKGRLIHLITEWHDKGELDESSVDPLLEGYLRGYKKFRSDTGFKPKLIEHQFYNQKYGYAGRIDDYGMLSNYMSVLDIKSGVLHESDGYQAAAYLFGMKDNRIPCWRAWDLYLNKNGTYHLIEIKNPTKLFMEFLRELKKWKETNQ